MNKQQIQSTPSANVAIAKFAPISHHLKTAVGGLDKMKCSARNAITKTKGLRMLITLVSHLFQTWRSLNI